MTKKDQSLRVVRRDELQPGDVITYPFLFPWQKEGGLTEAEKLRPAVVMLRFGSADDTYLAILPLTTRPIKNWEQRVLIPQDCRRAAGLNPGRCQSIVIDSCNVERLMPADDKNAKTYLPCEVKVGRLDDVVMDEVCRRFRNLQSRSKVHLVQRKATEPAPQPEADTVTPIPGY